MTKLIYGQNDILNIWISRRLFGIDDRFKDAKSIGVVDDAEKEIIAVVAYTDIRDNYLGNLYSAEMSITSIDKRWATRNNIRAFFEYPFAQLCLERVQTLCSAKDEGVINFNEKAGFKAEGYHRNAWHFGGDAISWAMLKHECRWL